MREVIQALLAACSAGETATLASVVSTFSSAPRSPGSAMLVTAAGEVLGSVSGGCVDGAVYDACRQVAASGRAGLLQFGVSDESAFGVGLSCGGVIDVFVEPISAMTFPGLDGLAADLAQGRPVAVATVTEHPDPALLGRHLIVRPGSLTGSLGQQALDAAVLQSARAMLSAARTGVIRIGADGAPAGCEAAVFVASFLPPPRMIICGGNDVARALAGQARLLGYRVTICDARPLFATTARFPEADEVVLSWPHTYLEAQIEAGLVDERTAICVLTHDAKFDIPLLQRALRDCPAGYVGAIGSRRTHDDRLRRLGLAGVTAVELDRLCSPIGLDLGGATPAETALSIMAEVVMLARGGTSQRLSRCSGRIHPAQSLRS